MTKPNPVIRELRTPSGTRVQARWYDGGRVILRHFEADGPVDEIVTEAEAEALFERGELLHPEEEK